MHSCDHGQGRDCLLCDPLFGVDTPHGRRTMTLPEIVAGLLGGDEVMGFPGLARVQRGAWWRFLVRAGAQVMAADQFKLGGTEVHDATELQVAVEERMRREAPGGWCLYQPDHGRPGFLQSPVPAALRDTGLECDPGSAGLFYGGGLKNHHRKTRGVQDSDAEQMVYALVTLQGIVSWGGRGNQATQFSIRRGHGCGTPFVGVRLPTLGETFRNDVAVLLASVERLRALGLEGDLWALWTYPFDTNSSIPLADLAPFFVPFARIRRLDEPTQTGRYAGVRRWNSSARMVADPSEGGDLGDTFSPLQVDKDRRRVLGATPEGYGYRGVCNVLFGEDMVPPASITEDPEMRVRRATVVRLLFEGVEYAGAVPVTFHCSEVPLPQRGAVSLIEEPVESRVLATAFLKAADDGRKALQVGLARVLERAPGKKLSNAQWGRINVWVDHFESRVDSTFFRHFGQALGADGQDRDLAKLAWATHVANQAEDVFRAALPALPVAGHGRYRAQTLGEAALRGQLRRAGLREAQPIEEGEAT